MKVRAGLIFFLAAFVFSGCRAPAAGQDRQRPGDRDQVEREYLNRHF